MTVSSDLNGSRDEASDSFGQNHDIEYEEGQKCHEQHQQEKPADVVFHGVHAEEAEEGDFELEEDVFSLLFVVGGSWRGLCIALSTCFAQISILLLIYVDLLNDDLRPAGVKDDNKLNIPVFVEWQVSVSQILALIVAVTTHQGVLVSIDALFLAVFDVNSIFLRDIPSATHWNWITTNVVRWIVGLLLLGIIYLIVLQSDNVLDIFMNFAAVEFLDNLDNAAFHLVSSGHFGVQMQRHADQVRGIRLHRHRAHWRVGMAQIAFAANLAFLVVGWSVARVQQKSGIFLASEACDSVLVDFGDVVFEFDPLDTGLPTPLFYEFFNGEYFAVLDSDKRPVYYERSASTTNNDRRGKFYYCDEEKSWHFTIPALLEVIPEGTKRFCKEGWLLQSPITDAYMLEDVSTEYWKSVLEEGLVHTLDDWTIRCGECMRAADCSLNGHCVAGSCECFDGWQGFECNLKAPFCEHLVFVHYGSDSRLYSQSPRYSLVRKEVNGSLIEIYSRPLFADASFHTSGCGSVLAYSGGRWYEMTTCRDQLFSGEFHGYWDGWSADENQWRVRWFSDHTKHEMPVGFEWNELLPSLSTGDGGGPYESSQKLHGGFQCWNVTCGFRTCGLHGDCVDTSGRGDFQCQCRDFYGGYFCKYDWRHSYSRREFQVLKDVLLETGYPNVNPLLLDQAIEEAGVVSEYYKRFWRPYIHRVIAGNETDSFEWKTNWWEAYPYLVNDERLFHDID